MHSYFADDVFVPAAAYSNLTHKAAPYSSITHKPLPVYNDNVVATFVLYRAPVGVLGTSSSLPHLVSCNEVLQKLLCIEGSCNSKFSQGKIKKLCLDYEVK